EQRAIVLRVFKDLHKTRRHVFRDDDRALTGVNKPTPYANNNCLHT
uniref:Uncharacterized protein n=1 Tax=Sinocyclocheilus anshuiensis TaxID=1608454 RepID=A0A671PK32_9TELE